jgi:hypothetical protein
MASNIQKAKANLQKCRNKLHSELRALFERACKAERIVVMLIEKYHPLRIYQLF